MTVLCCKPAPGAADAFLRASRAAEGPAGEDRQPRAGRRPIWELSCHLHCSIVGTCLPTKELRRVLARARQQTEGTEHALHMAGVALAARPDLARPLQRALEARHAAAIRRFAAATDAAAVAALWRQARQEGEVAGAYWAALTHPATDARLSAALFGEVHMLSHLAGTASRAELHRASRLEAELAEARTRMGAQQARLDAAEAACARQAQRIAALEAALAARASPAPVPLPAAVPEGGRVQALQDRIALLEAERQCARARLAPPATVAPPPEAAAPAGPRPALDGATILYVGGRPGLVERLGREVEQRGGALLHHDGGLEESGERLAGLVHRADLVLFPVDCVSHAAARMVKRQCRRAAKPYRPLRGAGLAPVLAALGPEPRGPLA